MEMVTLALDALLPEVMVQRSLMFRPGHAGNMRVPLGIFVGRKVCQTRRDDVHLLAKVMVDIERQAIMLGQYELALCRFGPQSAKSVLSVVGVQVGKDM